MIEADRKAPLPVTDQRRADERGNLERREFLGAGPRIGGDIADHDDLPGTRDPNEFVLHEVRQTMNTHQARHIRAMPVMADHHLFRRFVDVDKCADR